MNNDYTDLTIVLDRSGSMQNIRTDMEGGFNEFIKNQRTVPGECRVSLYQFDTQYEKVYANLPVSEVPPLNLVPRGGTALLDAVGRTIIATGDRLRNMPESQRPGKVIFLIITDGQENSSNEFRFDNIKAMVEEQRGKYSWEFVFIGAGIDTFQGQQMGLAPGKMLAAAGNARGTKMSWDSLDNKMRSYRGMSQEQYCLNVASPDFFDKDDLDAQERAKQS